MTSSPTAGKATFDYADTLLATPLGDYLKRCRVVTEAHMKAGANWTAREQMLKIYEEVGELHEALKKGYGDDPKCFEICDVVLAALTIFHVQHYSDRDIAFWLEKTLTKIENRVRP